MITLLIDRQFEAKNKPIWRTVYYIPVMSKDSQKRAENILYYYQKKDPQGQYRIKETERVISIPPMCGLRKDTSE